MPKVVRIYYTSTLILLIWLTESFKRLQVRFSETVLPIIALEFCSSLTKKDKNKVLSYILRKSLEIIFACDISKFYNIWYMSNEKINWEGFLVCEEIKLSPM